VNVTDDEVVALGDFCETLLQQPSFNHLVALREDDLAKTILSTAPHEKDIREAAHASYNGLREFLGVMKSLVDRKRVLTETSEPDLSPDDGDDADHWITQDIYP
jgi:hypothetical protein